MKLRARHASRSYSVTALVSALTVLALAVPAAAQAPWKPSRNVELVVGAGAGGPLDIAARTIERIFRDRKIVEMPAIVVNKPGAGGVLGFNHLNQHPGDGHFLAVTSTTLLTNHIVGTATITHSDLTPVALLFNEYVAFAVRADSPIKTARALAERLKADPGSVSISIASALGNHNHMGAALLAKSVDADVRKLRIVVNKSSGESVTVLLGGHVQAAAATTSNFVAQVQAGTLRVLGIAAPARIPGEFANVPTLREQGLNVVMGAWRGVVGPKGMTPAQLAYWEDAFTRLVQSPEWKSELAARLYADSFMKHKESAEYLRAEYAQLAGLLAEVGLAKPR